MGHDPQARALADVSLVTHGGGVVHTDHALGTVDFAASFAPGELAGAGHQGASPAVHLQRLEKGKRRG